MSVNIPGIIAVAVFYLAILIIGIVMGKKTNKDKSNEAVLVADRSLNLFVSIFTITATNVGGGYILGSAESAAWSGLLQTIAPVGYFMAFIWASLFYAPKMRREGYITVFDPFQLKYGRKMGGILFIPQLLGDLFWSAAVLSALGATISIILDMNATLAIILSAAVAIIYTFLGGLYSVAYTDVIQLFFIVIGLVLAFPFCFAHPAVDMSRISDTWLGEVPSNTIAAYIDVWLMCMMGGIPWQALYQRVLACNSVRTAWLATLISGILSLLLGIPPILMGYAGAAADWNATDYTGPVPIPDNMKSYILPLALHYLTPAAVGIVGIGAISAAVMSSCDSAILSSSSVFTKNIYQDIIRPKASQTELIWVLRVAIVATGTLATLIAIFSTTIYGLFVMCSDLMYVVLFPQLTLVLWMPKSNAYGSLVGFTVSLVLRVLSGEPVLDLPAIIKFPYFDEETQMQLFPHRTFAMMLGMLCIVVVSMVTHVLFTKGVVPRKYDILKCYRQRTIKRHHNVIDKQGMEDNEQSITLTNFHVDSTMTT